MASQPDLASLISEIRTRKERYYRNARRQEIAFWIGSCVSAVCSAIAGLSIAADFSLWNPPIGKVIVSVLAIVPVIWSAVERSLKLRQVSAFNNAMSTALRALEVETTYSSSADLDKSAKSFADVLRSAVGGFSRILGDTEENLRPPT